MKSLEAIKILLFVVNFLFIFKIPAVFCQDFSKTAQDNINNKEKNSFFQRVISGKYNLIEEDFYDVPHKPNKFDYIQEKMEELRTFSRPDDEFAILNLQWKDGEIFINDFKTVPGKRKTRRGFFERKNKGLYYRLFSGNKEQPVHEEYFDIPFTLHFDFLDEKTGEVGGGAFNRSETDFVIKIPLSDKTAEKIIFFKKPDLTKDRKGLSPSGEKVLGETLF